MSDAFPSDRHHSNGSIPVELAAEPLDIALGRAGEDEDGFPLDGPPRPRHAWSRRRRIVFGFLLIVGLAGAVTAGGYGWRIADQKDAVLGTPTTVAGLTRDDGPDAASTADYLRNGLAADVDVDDSIGVVYRDPADARRSVLLVGGTALVWRPEQDLSSAFGLLSDRSGAVRDVHEVPAGALGGVMKCGSTRTDDGDLAVCGWADHGSVALAMFPSRSVADSANLLRAMRGAIQSRR